MITLNSPSSSPLPALSPTSTTKSSLSCPSFKDLCNRVWQVIKEFLSRCAKACISYLAPVWDRVLTVCVRALLASFCGPLPMTLFRSPAPDLESQTPNPQPQFSPNTESPAAV